MGTKSYKTGKAIRKIEKKVEKLEESPGFAGQDAG